MLNEGNEQRRKQKKQESRRWQLGTLLNWAPQVELISLQAAACAKSKKC